MSDVSSIDNFLGTFAATVARQRIEKMIRGKKITLEAVDPKSPEEVFAEHISIIMLWSMVGAMFLKIHFDLDTAMVLAAGGLEKSKEEISKEMALDFMKECSNGVGGYMRSLLEADQLLMGMSLPFLAEGTDEVIFRKIRDPRALASNWSMRCDTGEAFHFTAEICLLDKKSIESRRAKLEENIAEGEKADSSGDVQFDF